MKRKHLLYGLGTCTVLFGLVQLVPLDRTNPPVAADLQAPPEVKAILKASCYDCHSNETAWPWYSRVAPVSWLVYRDTMAGREHLNFSEWGQYPAPQQARILAGALRRIKRGSMPPWFYTIKHTDGKITAQKLAVLEAWAAQQPK
jgi:hypothetical protein